MNNASTTAEPRFPCNLQPSRRIRPLPPATVELLIMLQLLLIQARHLCDIAARLVEHALAHLMQGFGSAPTRFVLTNLARGILRAIALQHVCAGDQPHPAADQSRRPHAAPARHPAGARSSHGGLARLPTLRQLEAAIRRQSAEHAIAQINREFGIALSLCEPRFGNALRDVVAAYRDTISGFFTDLQRPEALVTDAPAPESAPLFPPRHCDDSERVIVGSLSQELACGFPANLQSFAATIAEAHPP